MRRCRFAAAACLLWCTLPEVLMADSLFGLGLPGANGISADGSTVVGRTNGPEGLQGYRWTSSSGAVFLPHLAGSEKLTASATAVSANGGVVVGWDGFNPGGHQAYRWTSAGGTLPLPAAAGQGPWEANAVSANGNVVAGSNAINSFRWTQATGTVVLNNSPGIPHTFANTTVTGISGSGNTIVGYGFASTFPEAFEWRSGVGMFSMGIGQATPTAVSSSGDVVVGYTGGPSDEAFLWTLDEGKQLLGDLPGGAFNSHANAVSGDGRVVVGYGTSGAGQRAMVWTSATGMFDLRDFLSARGATGLTGWTLFEATGVSGDGLTITGNGLDPTGHSQAWVAIIPEPSTWAIALIGGLFLIAARRRARGR
jgi:probable HAF family extracellular repeat protein